jgi:N-acetylglutamate synthase-like GNAT family acetyltransferase
VISIRTATVDDIPAIKALYRRSSLSNEGDRTLLGIHPEFLEWCEEPIGHGKTRVAVAHSGEVLGFATVSPCESMIEIEDLFVVPESMRQGIGRALVEDALNTARDADLLCIEVDANPHSLAFYAKVGFAEIGQTKLDHGFAIRMRRLASPGPSN